MAVCILIGTLLLTTMVNSTFGWHVDLPHAVVVDDARVSYKPYEDTWAAFKETFERKFNKSEDATRFQLFVERLKEFEKHNKKYVAREIGYSVDINGFTDMTEAERSLRTSCSLEGLYDGGRHKRSSSFCTQYNAPTGEKLKNSFDWRETRCVTGVKDQGNCGSCYAFGAVATLETKLCTKTGRLQALSEQQIVDCCGSGCNGGNANMVYSCLHDLGGLMSSADYESRYVARKRKNCSFKKNKQNVTVAGCKYMTGESAKMEAVALEGPMYSSITVDDLFDYSSGVYTNDSCGKTGGHCVVIMGYGTDKRTGYKYWLAKNSYGPTDGLDGYWKIKRGTDTCGLESLRSYFPIINAGATLWIGAQFSTVFGTFLLTFLYRVCRFG